MVEAWKHEPGQKKEKKKKKGGRGKDFGALLSPSLSLPPKFFKPGLIGFLTPLHIAFSYIFVILNSTQVNSSTTFCSWVEIRAYLRRDVCQKYWKASPYRRIIQIFF